MSVRRIVVQGSRHYVVPGRDRPVPSVTSVLGVINKPVLNRWKQKKSAESAVEKLLAYQKQFGDVQPPKSFIAETMTQAMESPDAVGQAAASQGTSAHNMIDKVLLMDAKQRTQKMDYEKRQNPREFAKIKGALSAFDKFAVETEPWLELVKQDTVVYSLKHGYAGALDALGRRKSDGALIALDWKTSNYLHVEYALQVAAYARAWEEMHGEPVRYAYVVRFDKMKPKYQIRQVRCLDEAFLAFEGALNLWKAIKEPLLQTPVELFDEAPVEMT